MIDFALFIVLEVFNIKKIIFAELFTLDKNLKREEIIDKKEILINILPN